MINYINFSFTSATYFQYPHVLLQLIKTPYKITTI